MSFNTAQKKAIEHKEGPLLVVAGPGSGKTTVVVNRTKRLIEKGVKPENILVITFTKMAAKEMETRFESLTEAEYPAVTFGTIHSVALNILVTSFGYTYENILSEREKWSILRQMIYSLKIETDDMTTLIRNLLNNISLIKIGEESSAYNNDIGVRVEQMQAIYKGYQNYCQTHNKIDYDDMQIKCLELLLENPKELKFWQKLYQYILVDEFQDVDKLQSKLIYLLAKPQNNICIVGDDDQSLYQFRGARPEIMLDFEKEFDAKKITLDTNYRSGKLIVDTTSGFIQTNTDRFDKDFKSVKKKGKVRMDCFETSEEQAKGVIRNIKELLKKKVPYEEIAIIYRTNKESTMIISDLMEQNIPFVAKAENVVNMFEHWIFKDILNFYEVSRNVNKAPYDKIKRALKRPTRYLPGEALKESKTLADIVTWGLSHKKTYIARNIVKFKDDMNILKKKKTVRDFLTYLIDVMDYKKAVVDYAEYNKLNVYECVEMLEEILSSAKDFSNFEDWIAHASDYSVTLKESADTSQEGIRLLTMHSSKGLEFKHVFIINANEGYTPHRKGVEEEERRMFYVAMTRAKEFVHISYFEYTGAKKKPTKRSRFIDEIDSVLENIFKEKALKGKK